MRKLYQVIMFIPNQIVALFSVVLGFIGKIGKLLFQVAGSIFALGAIIIFISGRDYGFVGIILAGLSAACFWGQKLFAVLQQGLFTLQDWFSSKK